MTALGRVVAAIVLVLGVLVVSRPAHARPTATTTAPSTAEAGEPFVVELRVTSDEGPLRAEEPTLTPPIGVAASPPSLSFFSNTQTFNGVRRSQSEVRARWTLRAREPGRYVIEPPSIGIRGRRIRGTRVVVDVVAAGPGRASPPPAPPGVQFQLSWPFGPGSVDEPLEDEDPKGDLALPSAPPGKDVLFLRAVADQTTAYVGEQVTLSFYLYVRVPDVEWTDRTEAPLADFLRMPLVRDPATTGTTMTTVGGRRWAVKLLDRVAIFPLRAGKLSTGAMTARFRGRRIGSQVLETSNDVVIEAIEPPEAGRPPGYVVGDVGDFTMEADVSPRDLKVGGTFTATIRVRGEGNPPASIALPRRPGVEWLDPDKSVDHVVRGGRVGGVRTFKVLGEVSRGGYVELGAVEVPYWNAEKKEYAIARADLGGLRVEGTTPPPAPSAAAGAAEVEADALAALPAPRGAARAHVASPAPAVPLGWLLGAVAAPPLLVLAGLGGLRLARGTRERLDARRDVPGARVRDALDEAREADRRGDAQAVAGAVERAAHLAIEAATGLRSRGVLLRDLADAMADGGVDPAVASRAADVLRDAETLRFDPTAEAASRTDLVVRARAVCRELLRA
jgi:hypothetical protein